MNNARDGKMPAYLWYPADWLSSSSVRRMTRWERSCYRDLLDHAWLDGGIPDSLEEIARLLGEPIDQLRASWERLRAMFKAGPAGLLVNPRQESERAIQAAFRAAKSNSGKAGADARWRDKRTDGNAIDSPLAKNGSSPAPAPAQKREEKTRRASAPFDWRAVLAEFHALDVDTVRAAVEAYLPARKQVWTNQGMRIALRKLAKLGPAEAVVAFEMATEGGWKTLWPRTDQKRWGVVRSEAPPPPTIEEIRRRDAEERAAKDAAYALRKGGVA